MVEVAVIGTSYVGSVTAFCGAWLGHRVVGFDVDPARTGQLAAGRLPSVEPGPRGMPDMAQVASAARAVARHPALSGFGW